MCCIFTTLVFLGPRMALFVWWLLSPARFDHAFNTWYWPILGFIFVPFTTLMYVAVRSGWGCRSLSTSPSTQEADMEIGTACRASPRRSTHKTSLHRQLKLGFSD